MNLRALRRRKARGENRIGIKVGSNSIRMMTDVEFSNLIARLQKRSALRVKCRGHKKQYKRLRRLASLIRDRGKPMLFFYKESKLLDRFYPGRANKWRSYNRRTQRDDIKLKLFSFLDNPINTMKSLSEITLAEAERKASKIDFEDDICYDLGPFVVLAMMRKDMANVFAGGRMSASVAGAIQAVKLKGPLRIGKMPNPSDDMVVFPFTLRGRRAAGKSTRDNLPDAPTTEEKVSQDFVFTLDDWLKNLDKPFSLTQGGRENVYKMILETLDNAKRHSDIAKKDGQWHIAGMMQGPLVNSANETDFFMCNLTILSLGDTIYESLQTAPDDKRQDIEKYVKMHKSADLHEEVLWNVCALQDGISRCDSTVESPSNGYGLGIALASFLGLLSLNKSEEIQPTMSIVSGSSCIMIKPPYTIKDDRDGYRTIAFNAENDIAKPPDKGYVQYLPISFPGTLITIRFFLDSVHLKSLVEKNDKH